MNLINKIGFYKKRKEHENYKLALSEFHKSLTLITDTKLITSYVIAKIQEIIKVNKVFLFLYNEDYHRFVLSNVTGVDKTLYSRYYFTQKDKLIHWLNVNEKYIIFNQDNGVQSFFSSHEKNILKELDVNYVHPLKVMNRLIGVIFLGQKLNESEYNKNDIELLSILLDQAAFAFENTNLYQNQKDRIKKMYRADRLAILGQLAAGAAHEIRNPLTSIRSTIQYIKKGIKDPVKAKMTSGLLEEVDRINDIILGLLSFSNPDILKQEQIDLEELINQTVLLVSNTAKKKNCLISVDFNANRNDLFADASQLKQVFLNIIMNSIESIIDKGIIRITIDLNERYEKGANEPINEYLITIKDNGGGISQEDMENIFDPFYTTRIDGTGLGLSISYGIITQHNGDVSIESKLGKGTKVVIKLPINELQELEL